MLTDTINMLDGSNADNMAIVGGTSFPGTTHAGELFFRTDEDKLYIRNASDTGWIDLAASGNVLGLNDQTGTSYVLVLADGEGKVVTMNNASANSITVPPNSSVAFPLGTQILIEQRGAGQTTIAPGAGVTLNSAGGLLSAAAQYSMLTLIKVAIDTWTVAGDLA